MPQVKRDSRGAIAAAARAEFAALGFSGARVERIAKQAGVNKQLVFYYFGSKADLYRSVIAAARAELEGAVSTIDQSRNPSPRQLREVLTSLCGVLADRADLVRLLFVRQAGDGDQDTLVGAIVDACAAPLAQLISNGQGLGYYRDDADPDTLARHAVVLAVGYIGLRRSSTEEAPQPNWVLSIADLLSRGLAW